ncbi:MAG: hypothetical protein HYW24_04785 [Candidatus Aenigmarchaeota archaeon]|nr:hypothetical protein [Candidatus Aenigmarchaeota archaeon]
MTSDTEHKILSTRLRVDSVVAVRTFHKFLYNLGDHLSPDYDISGETRYGDVRGSPTHVLRVSEPIIGPFKRSLIEVYLIGSKDPTPYTKLADSYKGPEGDNVRVEALFDHNTLGLGDVVKTAVPEAVDAHYKHPSYWFIESFSAHKGRQKKN